MTLNTTNSIRKCASSNDIVSIMGHGSVTKQLTSNSLSCALDEHMTNIDIPNPGTAIHSGYRLHTPAMWQPGNELFGPSALASQQFLLLP